MIDNKGKRILKSINKVKLISFIFIFLIFSFNFFMFSYHSEISSKKDNKCHPTDNKIYWKNQNQLEIRKCRKEVRNSDSLKISFDNKNDFLKKENPKISLIITTYNQGYFINKLYASIQQQEFKDIEIIFVDDDSTDDSSFIIQNLMEKDKRIIYLKNEVNRRQYYSIAIGILLSKGEYILSLDADDYLLNNILIKAYETAKYYDLDIVQYYILINMKVWNTKYKSGIICGNKNIRNLFYYGFSRNLPDKLIRRKIYIKAINFMKKELYNKDYHIHTDDTFFFGIIHFANSYCFLEQIGYFYNIDPNRNMKYSRKEYKIMKINKDIKSLFNIMKYFILQSDNNNIEKNNIPYKFFELKVKKQLEKNLKYIIKDFDFYIDVLNLYLKCPFFNFKKKRTIKKLIHKIIMKRNNYKIIKRSNYKT